MIPSILQKIRAEETKVELSEEEKKKQMAEEKKRLRQVRKAEMKALRIKRKEELKIEREKQKLSKEIKMAKRNIKKVEEKYLKLLREDKTEEMKSKLKVLWYNMDCVIEQRNKKISELAEQLEEDDDRTKVNAQMVAEVIDSIIVNMFQRFQEINENFADEVKMILNEWKKERRILCTQSEDAVNEIKLHYYLTEKQLSDFKQDHSVATINKRDDAVDRYAVELQNLIRDYEISYSKAWICICNFLTDHEKQISEKRRQYYAEKAKHEKSVKLIDQQAKRIVCLTQESKNLKIELNKVIEDYYMSDLKEVVEDLKNKENNVRNEMKMEEKLDVKKITTLTIASNESIKGLGEKIRKAEKVLALCAVCRKMETLEEKTAPFGPYSLYEKPQKGYLSGATSVSSMASISSVASDKYIAREFKDELSELNLFWIRVANADIQREELTVIKDMLVKENAKLKRKLCEVLDCRCAFLGNKDIPDEAFNIKTKTIGPSRDKSKA